ncbi:MAG: DUF1622 domain-containing protein [Cellulosilyticaceae bacterium]
MLETLMADLLPLLIHILETMGIIILTIGAFKAFFHYLRSLITDDDYAIKHEFATSMAMALEFKLAAEILKTVLVRNLDEIFILGAIVVLRALITLIIHWEMKQDQTHKKSS